MRRLALPGEVRVIVDPARLAVAAATWLGERSAAPQPFRIAVSGGTTPGLLYDELASPERSGEVDWARWHVYFADERAVPPEHEASNYRLLHDRLLSRVPVPPGQVHRIPAERADLDATAAEYSRLLEEGCGRPPRLDVVLLGLGENGHTASLFPDTEALRVDDAWATRGRADYEPFDRVTLTFSTINAAAAVAFLVTGASKGNALRGVIEGTVPAAGVRPPDGTLLWFLDDAASTTLG